MIALINNYSDEIFDNFKLHFKNTLARKSEISFEEIKSLVAREYQISNESLSELDLLKIWFEDVYNLNYIKNIVHNDVFNEIIFHGPQCYQIIKDIKVGHQFNISSDDYQLSLEVFALRNNIIWNSKDSFVSFNWEYFGRSYRVTLSHFSNGEKSSSKIFIRAHNHNTLELSSFGASDETQILLSEMVKTKKNIIIAGSTGSGKTSLANTLLNSIGEDEHAILIEDVSELCKKKKTMTSLIARESFGKTLTDFCAYALRMSPDRIILGEIRSKEVVPMLLALNSGQEGFISTIHSNSAVDAISRIKLLFSIYSNIENIKGEYLIELICRNLDYIIFVNNKKITEIIRLIGADEGRPIYEKIL
jgi:type IV secretory pathway ATPase VirB11/archaellum biosynthesis ATPase